MLIKKERKYVIATIENPTHYLVSKHWGNYTFVDDIGLATKFIGKKTAKLALKIFEQDTNYVDTTAIVPLEITYELIEE